MSNSPCDWCCGNLDDHEVGCPSAPYLEKHREDGSTLRIYREPHQCPSCHAMRAFLVNRNGRTVCSACDASESPGEHVALEVDFEARLKRALIANGVPVTGRTGVC